LLEEELEGEAGVFMRRHAVLSGASPPPG
jgi:hypothetical protein